jgi:riboflavin kinase/FMN adenylyltransferase
MQLFRGFQHQHFQDNPIAATIGNFDGVHLGHQALIQALKLQAAKHLLPTAVILFEPQPAEYFQREQAPARLYSLREKLRQLAQLGIDYAICLKFDKKMALRPADDFAKRILFNTLNIKYLLTGEDFRFGYQRQGNYETLQRQAKLCHAEVDCFNNFTVEKNRVSSTNIRQALERGDFESAERLLGRTYAISGRVMHGDKRGRKWGIPTANIKLSHNRMPIQGVFDVWVMRSNGQAHAGVANIGNRPTVDGTTFFLEVHLHHFEQSLYGERLRVVFLHKRRDEIKFANVDDLIRQIHQDIQESEAYFAKPNNFDR